MNVKTFPGDFTDISAKTEALKTTDSLPCMIRRISGKKNRISASDRVNKINKAKINSFLNAAILQMLCVMI